MTQTKNNVKTIFANALGIKEEMVQDSLEYNTITEWDSIAHMTLIAELEEAYDIMFETEDIIDMSSFLKVKEILSKYDVNV